MTPAPRNLLAVDFGASGGKCFVGTFDAGGFAMREIHRFAHEAVPFQVAAHGALCERLHWDDTLLHRQILTALETFRREIAPTLDGLGIDTWGADGQLMTPDGDPVGKFYCYRDHRLDPMIERVKARLDPERIYAITGIHFQPFNVSNQLLWLVENRAITRQAGMFYLPAPTLFYWYLGGVRQVDSSWASITQLMDARARQWSPELLAALAIPPGLLPEIVPPGRVLGRLHAPLARALNLNEVPLVAAGAHDTASAFAAAPVADTDEALIISSGTWSIVGKLLPEPITSPAAMRANISNEGGIGNVRFLKNCMGTWLVQELRRRWRAADGRETPWAELDAATLAAPAFAALIDPDDPGFYNPPDMAEAIAAYCRRTGQTPPASRGSLLRTVYESLALKYRLVNDQIVAVCGKPTRVVHIVGGGSRNVLLNRLTANALGLPVLAGPEEATAIGNLMVQAMGLGLIGSLRDAMPIIRQAFPIKEFPPDADRTVWNQAFERFTRLTSPRA